MASRGQRVSFCGSVQVVVWSLRFCSCRRYQIAGANSGRNGYRASDDVERRVNNVNSMTFARRPQFRYASRWFKQVGVAIVDIIQMSFLHATRNAAQTTTCRM